MKRMIIRIMFVLLSFSMAGCSMAAGDEPEPVPENGSIVTMEPDQEMQGEVSHGLAEDNSHFAVDLYQHLRSQEGNLFYSPYSISLALGMTIAGARGETQEQMAETMHFDLVQAELHPAFQLLNQELTNRGEGGHGRDGEGFRLHIVNALWGQEGYAFLQGFLDQLSRYYGAGLRQVNFREDAEGARLAINAWVEEQTEDRIENLIPRGVLNELTRLVLTNAVYFNAAWQQPFDEGMTVEDTFTRLDGEPVQVPMMQQSADFGYAVMDGFQVVELPYEGGELSMLILLPDANEFHRVEEAFSYELLEDALSGLRMKNLALRMPVFETSSAFDLSEALQALGMTDAFDRSADFSGMDGTRDLFISAVVHKAFVSVDEAGTEAAAATAVVMQLKALMDPPLTVSVDRPFLFLVRDNPTGSILFAGRILDPTQ